MNIQSLSICVPGKTCINSCKYCCSRMRRYECICNPREEIYPEVDFSSKVVINEYTKRMEFARDNGCNTVILTGEIEPQQNMSFLYKFKEMNESLKSPFKKIEIQTSGAFIDEVKLSQFRKIGINTIALSVACIGSDKANREIIGMRDKNFNLSKLCKKIKDYGFNLRLCLNITRYIDYGLGLGSGFDDIITRCKDLGADQVTFRKMYTFGESMEALWTKENTKGMYVSELLKDSIKIVKKEGTYLDTLEYGADRYSYRGISFVIDDDCMSKKENKVAVKYLILRPNGKLYSKWDTKASLVF